MKPQHQEFDFSLRAVEREVDDLVWRVKDHIVVKLREASLYIEQLEARVEYLEEQLEKAGGKR